MNSHQQKTLLASLVFIGMTFLQIGDAATRPFSLAYEKTLWPNKSVRVCFGNGSHYPMTGMPSISFRPEDTASLKNGEVMVDISTDVRAKIKSAIEKEYTLSRTGITFVGWKTCSEKAVEADVVILMGRENFSFSFDGYAAVGRNLDTESGVEDTTKKAFVYMNRPGNFHKADAPMTDDQFLKILAIHEFGHLAGLTHENFRMSKKNKDPNCALTMDAYNDFMENEAVEDEPIVVKDDPKTYVMAGVIAYSAYDPNSVMSYCYWDVLGTTTGMKFTVDSTLPEENKFEPNAKGHFAPGAVYLNDPLLFKKKEISGTVSEIQVRPGLSLSDIHTLRCLHSFYKPGVKTQKCTPAFVATRDVDLLKLVR